MKTVILCGGKGTRIRDVTSDAIPKPMLPLGGRPILWHIMKIYAHHGMTDFVLCLGYKAWMIKEFFLNYEAMTTDITISLGRPPKVEYNHGHPEEGWRVTLADTGLESMTGYRVQQVRKYVGDETFCLTYGDGVSDVDLRQVLEFHRSHGRIGTMTCVRPRSRFGEIETKGQRAVSFAEKPDVSRVWINGGFCVLEPAFFDYLPDDPGCVLEREPLQRLTADGQLMVYEHEGFWQHMDTLREYEILNDLWSSGEAPWKVWPG